MNRNLSDADRLSRAMTECSEPRPCATCGLPIAAGQLYLVVGPRHVACEPPARLDVAQLAAAARARQEAMS